MGNSPARDRIRLREADFFNDPIGDDLDIVLLSDVMYGMSEAKVILQNAWNSLAENGMLVIRGYYSDTGGAGPLFGALFAVKMLVDDPQRKILHISDLEQMVIQTGFEIVQRAPLTERSYILLGKKPASENSRAFS